MRDDASQSPAVVTVPVALTLMLAGATGLAPFAMQAIAPATPAIERGLDVSPAAAQLFISLSMLAMAAGAVVYGPVADRFGRRPVLLVGLACSAIGSLLAAVAPDFWIALFGRLLQSAGAGAGMVLARAAARDLYGREEAAAMIARITAIMVAAPMIAPTVGGALVEVSGWRGVFAAIALLSAALFFWVWRDFAETLRAPTDRLDFRTVMQGYRDIASLRRFWLYAGYGCGSLATFFIFVGSAPRVMETAFGVGPAAYGVYFMVVAGVYMASNAICPAVTRRLGADPTIGLGAALTAIGPLGAAAAYGAGADGPLVLIAGAAVQSVGAGISVPNVMAGAVSAAPERAGAASGLTSVAQFAVTAPIVQAASWLPTSSGWPLAFAMGGVGVVAAALFAALYRLERLEHSR